MKGKELNFRNQFEKISWGIGSIKGAIRCVHIEEKDIKVDTIGEKAPVGLCGTGVIETVSELVRMEYVDETGRFDEDRFEEEEVILACNPEGRSIVFNQKDVREVQLAKAAVRAGIETLLLRYGCAYDQVKTVYLAGGFGFHVDHDKVIQIGMIPKEFSGRIKTIGNSSLGGALRYITDENAREVLDGLVSISTEINLSADKEFNEFYMEHMFF